MSDDDDEDDDDDEQFMSSTPAEAEEGFCLWVYGQAEDKGGDASVSEMLVLKGDCCYLWFVYLLKNEEIFFSLSRIFFVFSNFLTS